MVISRSWAGINLIRPLAKVVFPDPVAPEIRMFFRARTAASKNPGQSPASRRASRSVSSGFKASVDRLTAPNRPALTNSSMPKVAADGLRKVRETCSAAGGKTIWQRSPDGSTVEQIGVSAVTS